MRKVALIMESWMRYFTYAWPSGILRKIKESGLDVNLYIFNSSANWSDDELYNRGEYNIFRLPDLKEFDGIVLEINNIIDMEMRDDVVDKVRKSGVPAIVIGNYFEGLRSVAVNNYQAMQDVMEHLYGHHGCRRFWFVMGPENNYENKRRMLSINDYIEKHNIKDSKYYFGDFDCACGVKGFDKLYWKYDLPDAIVCANDNIAVGVLSEAEKMGLKAPEDFLVTGFDDLDKSRYYNPRISTVSYIREELGFAAMDMMHRIWQGEDVEKIRYIGTKMIFWDSCGCSSDITIDLKDHLKNNILYGIETEDFEKQLLKLKYSLTNCGSVQEMMERIPQCIPSLRCDELYIVTDKNLCCAMPDASFSEQMNVLITDAPFMTEGYPDDMEFGFSYTMDGIPETDRQTSVGKNIFPMFECEKSGVDFLFIPLHFREKCIGYFVIRNAVYLMEKQFLFDIINSLTTALENLYSKERLKDVNQILTALYNHDALTMLYNRMDLDRLGNMYLRTHHRKSDPVYIVYLDLDKLKYINDNFGHDQGDFAIKTLAKSLEDVFPKDSLLFRLGGDEFLVLCSGMDDSDMNSVYDTLQNLLSKRADENNCPYELGVSMGYVVSERDDKKSLAEHVQLADNKMYQCKIQRKKQRQE